MTDLINIEMNSKEITATIIQNIGKMFLRRGYMTTNSLPDDVIKQITVDNSSSFTLNDKKFSINILINQDVKNISSGSNIDDYLSKQLDEHKFLITKMFSKKTFKQIIEDYKNAEIFNIRELLEDIPSKHIIPEHQLLNETDKEELIKTFTAKELGRIYSTDMMARYYGAKIHDIFRISRPNINSGISIYYRVVVQGNLDFFI
jgi:DNA-directed RNA polymerase subunit H (RpoH/RPB5)